MTDRMPDFVAEYRSAPVKGGVRPLELEVFTPKAPAQGTVVYFHSGGFLGGSHLSGRQFADEANARDLTFVSVQYRLKAPADSLTSHWGAALSGLMAQKPKGFGLPDRYSTWPALAATEDGLLALEWLSANRLKYGLGAPRTAVLGMSAGGIVAANLAYVIPALNIPRPTISAVSVLSAALPHVGLCDLSRGPALQWVHGLDDTRLSAASARAAAQAARGRAAPTDFRLLDTNKHGVWLYRRAGLPGSNEIRRRAHLWKFLRDNIAYRET